MSESNERQYVGKGKWVEFRDGGGKFRISLTPEGVDLINRNATDSGWANLVMSEMRQPDRNGNQYTIYVDDWQPERRGSARPASNGRPSADGRPQTERSSRPVNNGGFGGHKYDRADTQPGPASEDEIPDIPF